MTEHASSPSIPGHPGRARMVAALDGTWSARLLRHRDDPDHRAPAPDVLARLAAGFDATVPGHIHHELQREGVIPDPFVDDNERRIGWVARTDWRYQRRLERPSGTWERAELVFDGIDTVSRVALDGHHLGDAADMHRSHRFDVTGLLTAPASELTVDITSPYEYTDRMRERFGPQPGPYAEPFALVRKMACSFGWDWGPTVPSSGIWRSVRLETWSTARFREVRTLTAWEADVASIDVLARVEQTAAGLGVPLAVRIEVTGPGVDTNVTVPLTDAPGGASGIDVSLPVPGAAAWWPRGYGAQPSYTVRLHLLEAASGRALDAESRRVGFRTVRLDTSEDGIGSGFTITVNGTPIAVRGFNWIPADILPSRVTPGRYRQQVADAVDAGANLLRVWGGGIYESDAFYDACDTAGVLVWQDFPFACSCYPEGEPLRSEIEAEARENVLRLSSHPSLALWCGNNENLWLHDHDDWEAELGGRPWGTEYYLRLLPTILAEVDPSRPYTAGSPWSGTRAIAPNSPDHGTFHSWEVWNAENFPAYRDSLPRFVAEFGWQAPPAWRTLRDAVTGPALAPDAAAVVWHQKAVNGQGKLAAGIRASFGELGELDFDAWHYLSQLVQVRAIRAGIEHWRSGWPRTAGVILWQLNDIWPGMSWSAVDSAGRRKPLHHELGRLFDDRLISIEPVGSGFLATIHNLATARWDARVVLEGRLGDGTVAESFVVERSVPPGTVEQVAVPDRLVAGLARPGAFLVADPGSEARALWFGDSDAGVPVVPAEYDVDLRADADDTIVTVTARTLVRDLLLQPDRLPGAGTVDHGFVTLLPGERAEFRVRNASVTRRDLAARFVLTSLADVLASSAAGPRS